MRSLHTKINYQKKQTKYVDVASLYYRQVLDWGGYIARLLQHRENVLPLAVLRWRNCTTNILYWVFLYFAEAPAGNVLPAKFLFRNYIFGRGVN